MGVSTTREIHIVDQYGGTLFATYDAGMIEVVSEPGRDRDSVELDETDRRDLRDWLAT